MARRLNTIIIVPHSKARFLKFSLSTRVLVTVTCAVIAALVLSVVAIVYTGSAVNRRLEVQRLKNENVELVRVNQELESTVTEVQGRLDEFEERTAKLALAAGMEAEAESDRWPDPVGYSSPTPAIFKMSSVASALKISITSSTVTIPTSWLFSSTTGTARISYLATIFATSSWSISVVTENTSVAMKFLSGVSGGTTTSCRKELTPTRRLYSSTT